MNIKINGKVSKISLEDNFVVREIMNMLPLEFKASDLNRNEKYYYLNERLSNRPQKVSKIEKGDIMLYDDDCLVIFYKSFNTPYDYTKIGKIENLSILDNIGEDDILVKIFL